MNQKRLAMRIRQLRESKQFTQEQIAEVLGIHQPAYSEMESGRTVLSVPVLDKLARFYNLSWNDFNPAGADW